MDTASDDHFMGLVRVHPEQILASSGFNPLNVYDLDDPGRGARPGLCVCGHCAHLGNA